MNAPNEQYAWTPAPKLQDALWTLVCDHRGIQAAELVSSLHPAGWRLSDRISPILMPSVPWAPSTGLGRVRVLYLALHLHPDPEIIDRLPSPEEWFNPRDVCKYLLWEHRNNLGFYSLPARFWLEQVRDHGDGYAMGGAWPEGRLRQAVMPILLGTTQSLEWLSVPYRTRLRQELLRQKREGK